MSRIALQPINTQQVRYFNPDNFYSFSRTLNNFKEIKRNINNKNTRLLVGKSTVILILLFTVNILYNKTYAQEAIPAASEFKEACTEKIITGETNLEQLEQIPEFWMEYLSYYADYVIDREKLRAIGEELNSKSIKIIAIIGTWCGDTKEQMPVLQKILDNLPEESRWTIEYVGVDRDKTVDGLDIASLGVNFIPAFIFYENDQEIGRIIETPSSTMENDIIRILRKE